MAVPFGRGPAPGRWVCHGVGSARGARARLVKLGRNVLKCVGALVSSQLWASWRARVVEKERRDVRALGGLRVDTLRAGAYAFELGRFGEQLARALAVVKSQHDEDAARVVVNVGGVDHQVGRGGGYPYGARVWCEEWVVSVAMGCQPGDKTPALLVTFRARALAEHGVEACWARFVELFALAGVRFELHREAMVSRVDLAVDVEGWALEGGRRSDFVTRASPGSREEREDEDATADELATFAGVPWAGEVVARGLRAVVSYRLGSRGRSGLLCRVYRKDVQSRQVPHAAWIRGVWAALGWQGFKPVTRVEFELGREVGVSIGLGEVAALFDASRLEGVWAYLTQRWCVMVARGTARYVGRQVEPAWECAAAVSRAEPCGRAPVERSEAAPEALLAQAAGCLARYLAEARGAPVGETVQQLLDRVAWKGSMGDLWLSPPRVAEVRRVSGGVPKSIAETGRQPGEDG